MLQVYALMEYGVIEFTLFMECMGDKSELGQRNILSLQCIHFDARYIIQGYEYHCKKNIYIYILNFHVLMTCNFNFWISFFDLNSKICDSCNRWIIVWQCLFKYNFKFVEASLLSTVTKSKFLNINL